MRMKDLLISGEDRYIVIARRTWRAMSWQAFGKEHSSEDYWEFANGRWFAARL